MFSSYPAHKLSNHKFSEVYKISPDTNLCKTKHTYIYKHQTQNFLRISPFGSDPVKKAHKARTRWYGGTFRLFSSARFFYSMKREWTQAIKKKKE